VGAGYVRFILINSGQVICKHPSLEIFKFFIALLLKIQNFWNRTPCRMLKGCRHLGGP